MSVAIAEGPSKYPGLILREQTGIFSVTLPTELITEILEEVRIENGPHKRIDASFQLAHVCKKWREIVLGTPRFWTDIPFNVDLPNEQKDSDILSRRLLKFRIAVQRSKDLLLGAYVFSQRRYCRHPPKELQTVLETLKTSIARVRTLELAIPGALLPQFSPVSAPSIRHFQLDIIDEHDRYDRRSEDPLNLEAITSRTETMRLRIYNMKYVRLCWDHVVELEASTLHPASLMQILRQATSLRKLKAFEVSSSDDFDQSKTVFVHPNLEELEITFDYDDGTKHHSGDFLMRVTMPSLRYLVLPDLYDYGVTQLIEFLRRSNCHLRRLLVASPDSGKDLESIMRLLPRLEELRLGSMPKISMAEVFAVVCGLSSLTQRSPRSLVKFSYDGWKGDRKADWSWLWRGLEAVPSLQDVQLTVLVNLGRTEMQTVWMNNEDILAIRKLRGEGRTIKVELWASGIHFEDFVEASHVKVPLK